MVIKNGLNFRIEERVKNTTPSQQPKFSLPSSTTLIQKLKTTLYHTRHEAFYSYERWQNPRNPELLLLLTTKNRLALHFSSWASCSGSEFNSSPYPVSYLLYSLWQALLLLQSAGIPIYSHQPFRVQNLEKCQNIFKSRGKFWSSYNVFSIFSPSCLHSCILKACFPSLSKGLSLPKVPIPFKIPITAPKKHKQD